MTTSAAPMKPLLKDSLPPNNQNLEIEKPKEEKTQTTSHRILHNIPSLILRTGIGALIGAKTAYLTKGKLINKAQFTKGSIIGGATIESTQAILKMFGYTKKQALITATAIAPISMVIVSVYSGIMMKLKKDFSLSPTTTGYLRGSTIMTIASVAFCSIQLLKQQEKEKS